MFIGEKLHITKEESSYMSIRNKVLQMLSDVDALAIYTYLLSFPNNKEFDYSDISKHFKIAKSRVDEALRKLCVLELIKIEKNEKERTFSILDDSYFLRMMEVTGGL